MTTRNTGRLNAFGTWPPLTAAVMFLALGARPALAAADKGSDKPAGLPQFDIETYPSQIFWLFVSFAILYTVLATAVLPRLGGILERRRARIESELAMAERLRKESDTVKQNYESILQEATQKAHNMVSEARREIQEESARKIADFDRQAAERMDAALREIESGKQRVIEEIESEIPAMASAAAQRLGQENLKEDTARQFLQTIRQNAG